MSIPKPLLFTYFNDTAEVLLSQYNRSAGQNASANLGRNREFFCSTFLSKVLPPKLYVTRGEIWDSKRNRTGQLDVIITRDDCPCLDMGSDNVYLAEGIFAVIEVKSNLTTDKLNEAAKSLRAVQNLSNNRRIIAHCGTNLDRPLRIVVAYEGATWETLLNHIETEKLADVFDLICILERGVAIKNGLLLSDVPDTTPKYSFSDPPMKRWEAMQAIAHPKPRPPPTSNFLLANGKAASLGFLYYHLITFASSFMEAIFSINDYFMPISQWDET